LSINYISSSLINNGNYLFKLNNILHCYNAPFNLLSIKSLSNDNNYVFKFDNNDFFIEDKTTKKMLHKGKADGILYPIRLHKAVLKVFNARKMIESCLHRILRHPSSYFLNKLVVSVRKNKLLCNSCNKSKSYKIPFFKSISRTSNILSSIHCDV
jgi:hypothetical protein